MDVKESKEEKRRIVPVESKEVKVSKEEKKVEPVTGSLRIGAIEYKCLSGPIGLTVCKNITPGSNVFIFNDEHFSDEGLCSSEYCSEFKNFLATWSENKGAGDVFIEEGAFFSGEVENNYPISLVTAYVINEGKRIKEGKKSNIRYHQADVRRVANVQVPFMPAAIFNPETHTVANFAELNDAQIRDIIDPAIAGWKEQSAENIKKYLGMYVYSDNFLQDFFEMTTKILDGNVEWTSISSENKVTHHEKEIKDFTLDDFKVHFSKGTTARHHHDEKKQWHKIRKQIMACPEDERKKILEYFDTTAEAESKLFKNALTAYSERLLTLDAKVQSRTLEPLAVTITNCFLRLAGILFNIYTIGRMIKVLYVYRSQFLVLYLGESHSMEIINFVRNNLRLADSNIIKPLMISKRCIDTSQLNINLTEDVMVETMDPSHHGGGSFGNHGGSHFARHTGYGYGQNYYRPYYRPIIPYRRPILPLPLIVPIVPPPVVYESPYTQTLIPPPGYRYDYDNLGRRVLVAISDPSIQHYGKVHRQEEIEDISGQYDAEDITSTYDPSIIIESADDSALDELGCFALCLPYIVNEMLE